MSTRPWTDEEFTAWKAAMTRPEALRELQALKAELDRDPAFVREMTERLVRIVESLPAPESR